MRHASLALAALLGCSSPSSPAYMQDSREEAKKVLQEMRDDLDGSFAVEKMDDVFYVASNAGETSLARCKGTITRMVEFLYRDFLTRKPSKPIRVYLFKDKSSYEAYCSKTYDKPPSTPFGFYMSCDRKMVMNISTGTGTLAHELVHPLLAEDFDGVPAWFNEGFASLYEQSQQDRDGRMKGLTNWRLPALQRALRDGKRLSLRDLLKTTTSEFYGDRSGLHYAMARYFCLWLQEQEQLVEYYKEFKGSFAKDATGISAVETVSGKKLEELEGTWKEWVRGLVYED
jgi:hypothetical protein